MTVYKGNEKKGAIFSKDGLHRYLLWRQLEPGLFGEPQGSVLFVGLNPSTADHEKSDPTCTREVDFASRWGFHRYVKANLFGFRSTDPLGLAHAKDPVGPQNLTTILDQAHTASLIVLCWGDGKGGKVKQLIQTESLALQAELCRVLTRVAGLLDEAPTPVRCFGVTQNGNPKHPLYLPKVSELTDWRLAHG